MVMQELDISTIEIVPGRNLREDFDTSDLEESMGAGGGYSSIHP